MNNAKRLRLLLEATQEYGAGREAAIALLERSVDVSCEADETTLEKLRRGELLIIGRRRIESILEELESLKSATKKSQ